MIYVIAEKAVDFTSPEVLAGYVATAIVAIVGLLLTIFILKKVLFKPLKNIMHERQREIDEAVEKNKRDQEALEERELAMRQQEEAQQALFNEERLTLEQSLASQKTRVLADADREAQKILDDAERALLDRQKNETERLYREAVELAVATMSRLYDRVLTMEEEEAIEHSVMQEQHRGKEGQVEA